VVQCSVIKQLDDQNEREQEELDRERGHSR